MYVNISCTAISTANKTEQNLLRYNKFVFLISYFFEIYICHELRYNKAYILQLVRTLILQYKLFCSV